jgi:hypothetical protein
MPEGRIMYLSFVTGEARPITREEHTRMAMERQARTIVKDGIVYVNCKPPSDEGRSDA